MLINKKLLSAVLSTAMILSTITAPVGKLSSANAKAVGKNSTISYKVSSTEKIADKIQKKLKDDFKTSTSKVTFLVKLKDQVDAVKVAKKATAKAETQGLTVYKTSLLKRSSIVSELKIKSDETQRSIRTYLNSQKKKGNVSSYESFYIVNGLAVTGTETVMNELAAMPEVESIEENATVHLNDNIEEASTTKASTTSTTTSSTTTDSNIEPNILQIGADKAWDLGIDGSGITIASLDSGVQWDHPALITKYRGYNPSDPSNPNNECNYFDAFSYASNSGSPYDDMGHGTHTMGTMVGSCTDGTNKIGVAPGAKWICARAFTINADTQDYTLLRAGQWLLAPVDYSGNTHPELAPNVINNSWGRDLGGADDWFRQVVINWKAAGIFPEFSAGNTNYYNDGGVESVVAPGSYPESFTTGAVDADNNLADFSLRGPSPYGVIKPDVTAPGVNIRSSVPGSGYDGSYSGTSMAGPCVTATAALIMQANPSLTVDQIEQVIRNTATQRTDSTYPTCPNNGYGYGVVNAYLAVSSVLSSGQGVGKVKGQVLKEGKDSVPPTFSETPVDHKFAGFELPLNITAHDDVSIKTVELQYIHNTGDQWITLATTQLNGDYKGGDYTATIPAAEITAPSLQYRWRIVDFGNNEVFSDIHTVTIQDSITDGYFTDFESGTEGWRSGGSSSQGPNSWWWGTPSQGIGRAASGTKVYATNTRGQYPDNDNIYAEMPKIDLPQGQSYLQFKQWYNVEAPWWMSSGDFCNVEISTDDTNWSNIASYTGDSGTDYTSVQLDLSAYAGQIIYIRFHFVANDWDSKDGWFIDDVGLSDQSIASAARTKYLMNKVARDNNGTSSISTSSEAATSGLPLYGRVTALENGTSAITSIADGSYSLSETAGDYTLKAESYGYYPQTRSIYVPKDSVMDNVNFKLNPIPKGLLTGKITNEQTGEPIANAVLYLIEDAAVAPVVTDSEGNYSINAYEGNYTLQVSAANYYDKSVSVGVTGNGNVTQDIQLKPYVGYSGQIAYDDGTAENATAASSSKNGFAVRMTLADGKSTAMLTTGMFMFCDEQFPEPGGTDFKIAVYDATGENGTPGNRIAGPFSATAIRDQSQWTTVDLSAYGIMVPHDFYLVYIQSDPYPYCPGICTDNNGNFAYRSYSLNSGKWTKGSVDLGNVMIRSAVNYDVQAPVITAPEDNLYTNNSTVTVKGTAKANTDIHILNNDKEAAVATSDNAGNFSADVSLAEGDNVFKAYSLGVTGRTDYSNESKVILDTAAPVLNITSPADNLKTDKEAVTVQGTINETNLDNIEVNGTKAEVNPDGTWSARITLNEGLNTVETVAMDKSSNKTTKTIKIDAKFSIQNITNLMPDKDVYIDAGSSVKVEFDSEPDLKNAVFTVSAPLLNNSNNVEKYGVEGSSALEYPMTEVVDENGNGNGHYVGYWKADSDVMANGAQIEVKVTDWYGNTLTQYAVGKLYANDGEKISVNRISGSDRYETSEKVAEAYGNGQKAANIILTSGNNFPDALSGSILTASLKAPMLLVGSGENNTKAYNYIKNYLADGGKVYILGGTGAVSQAVEDYVTKTLNKSVIRIAGADRFETNKNIINKLNPVKGTPVIIATSETFADALSVSSAAAIKGYPIILAEGKDLSASALSVIKNIQPASVYVIGGTAVVDENIITEIKAADSELTASDITRIAGSDRYETSLMLLEQFNLNKGNLVVATGTNFADALSGTALAVKENAPILLTDSSVLKNQISAMSKFTNITVLGGYGAVTQDVEYFLNMKPALPAYIETSLNETVSVGSRIVLPQTVTGYYADGTKLSMPVVWDKNASLDTSKAGTLIVTGAVEGYDAPVTLTITVKL